MKMPTIMLVGSLLLLAIFPLEIRANDNAESSTESLSTEESPTVPILPCTVCRDRSPVQNPDTDLSWLLEYIDEFPSLPGVPYTCQFVDTALLPLAALSETPIDEEQCELVRLILGGLCGCPPIAEDYCDMCPNDESVPLPDAKMNHVTEIVQERYPGFVPTCAQYDLMSEQLQSGNYLCYALQDYAWICGCNGGESSYLGADTRGKKIALAWIPRITGFLSLMGSVYIARDALSSKHARTLYHELLLGLSIYDIIGSMAWMFSTAPINRNTFGYEGHVYGAIGTPATCTAQGFFLQISLVGSISYNLMLSIFYILTIAYSYRGPQLIKFRKLLHLFPNVVALAIAIAGIPRYRSMLLICHIIKEDENFAQLEDLLIFTTIPICVVWFGATASMIFIYAKVRKTVQASSQWSFRAGLQQFRSQLSRKTEMTEDAENRTLSNRTLNSTTIQEIPRPTLPPRPMSRLEKTVFWQAFYYLLSFWLTWPLYMLAGWFSSDLYRVHAFWLTLVIFCPLQGFFNFLVYIRPRVLDAYEQRRRRQQIALRNNEALQNDTATSPRKHDGAHKTVPGERRFALSEESKA